MKRVLKWIGIGVAGLVGIIVILAGVLHFVGNGRLQKAPDVAVKTVEIHNNDEILARGEHLATISSCNGCHSMDLSGTVFNDEAPMGYLPASNLTSGAGGIGAAYTTEDWARAIRHGVAADGRPLMIMSSNHYAEYGDDDLAALIAYLQSVPPVDNELGERNVPFPGTIIFGVLAYDDVTAVNKIDHAAVGGDAPDAASATAVYGEYLVNIASCGSCHGENLAGQLDPNGPQGPNITMGGELQSWSQDDFFTAMRSGTAPGGREINPEMPWQAYAQMTDVELEAVWAFIQGEPALSNNTP